MVSLTLKRGELSPTGGLTAKGRRKYNKLTGSRLKAPVPYPKTKKERARKASFCARSKKWKRKRGKLARQKWNC